jgi:hypothetical protein
MSKGGRPEGGRDKGRNSFLCLETTKGIYLYFDNMTEKYLNDGNDEYDEDDKFCSVKDDIVGLTPR